MDRSSVDGGDAPISEAQAMRFWITEVLQVPENRAHRSPYVREIVCSAEDRGGYWKSCGFRQFAAWFADGSSIFVLQDEIRVR